MKVLTLNLSVWTKYDTDYKNRIKEFNKLLQEESPDIVFLQEVFLFTELLDFINHDMQHPEYHVAETGGTNLMNSGLVVMSKYKIVSNLFTKFDSRYTFGMLSKIRPFGFQHIIVLVGTTLMHLLNVHALPLEGSVWCDENTLIQAIKSQILQVYSYATPHTHWIIAGDMNTNHDYIQKHYRCIPDKPTVHSMYPMNTYHAYHKRVDHIYSNMKILNAEIILNYRVSDHFPLVATLNIDTQKI